MPLYEYQCEKCGHRFEKIQKFSDKMVKKCPECGGKVQQVISAPAVQFKGSGWYVTDYAKKPSSASDGKGSKKEEKSKTESGNSESSPKESPSKDSSKSSSPSSKKTEKHG